MWNRFRVVKKCHIFCVLFIECSSTSPLVSMSNDLTSETFSISTTSLYVTLDDELDYEVDTEYYLLLTVTDLGNSLTGYIAIRVNIKDLFVLFSDIYRHLVFVHLCLIRKEYNFKQNINKMYLPMSWCFLSPEVTFPKSLLQPWSFKLQIIIGDVNDNCPIISPTSVTLTPQPVLVESALATFSSSDADSGENANIHYVVSNITAE